MASYGKGEFGGDTNSYQSGGFSGTTMASRDSSNEFSRLSQTVSGNIQKITQNVRQIQQMVNQIGTPQDASEHRDRMHQTTHYTNQLAKETSKALRDLSSLPSPPNPSDQRQWRMQKTRLTEEFSNALKNFQTMQRTAAEKEKASVQRARTNSGMNKGLFDDEDNSQDQFQDQFGMAGFSQTKQILQMEEDVDLGLLQEREDAIHKLESDIRDVNQIFKDLGMLVHEQGETIDSIEKNVEDAHIHVEEGTQQLSKARDYQGKSRRKRLCFIIMAIVILAAVIGIIVGVAKNN